MNLFSTILTYKAPSGNYRGEGTKSRSVIQKITKGRFEYAIISSEALRNAIRETIGELGLPCNRKRLPDEEQLTVEFKDYPDADKYADDFFMGWLITLGSAERIKIRERVKEGWVYLKEDVMRSLNFKDDLKKFYEKIINTPLSKKEFKKELKKIEWLHLDSNIANSKIPEEKSNEIQKFFQNKFFSDTELKKFYKKNEFSDTEIEKIRPYIKKNNLSKEQIVKISNHTELKETVGRENFDKFTFKRDSIIRINLAESLLPYRHDSIFTQSPRNSDLSPWQNAKNSMLLHREVVVTPYQYPFAINLNDCISKPEWTKTLIKAIFQLNNVAGNHARSYYEMAPASIVVRLTEQLVAGYDTYGFQPNENGKPNKYILPEVIDGLLNGDYPGEEFFLGGQIVKDMPSENINDLKTKKVTLVRNPQDLLEILCTQINYYKIDDKVINGLKDNILDSKLTVLKSLKDRNLSKKELCEVLRKSNYTNEEEKAVIKNSQKTLSKGKEV